LLEIFEKLVERDDVGFSKEKDSIERLIVAQRINQEA